MPGTKYNDPLLALALSVTAVVGTVAGLAFLGNALQAGAAPTTTVFDTLSSHSDWSISLNGGDPVRVGQEMKAGSPWVGQKVNAITIRVYRFNDDGQQNTSQQYFVRIRDANDNIVRTIARPQISTVAPGTFEDKTFSFTRTTIQAGYKFTVEFAGTPGSYASGLEVAALSPDQKTLSASQTEGYDYQGTGTPQYWQTGTAPYGGSIDIAMKLTN